MVGGSKGKEKKGQCEIGRDVLVTAERMYQECGQEDIIGLKRSDMIFQRKFKDHGGQF